jgi:hypothetical protein
MHVHQQVVRDAKRQREYTRDLLLASELNQPCYNLLGNVVCNIMPRASSTGIALHGYLDITPVKVLLRDIVRSATGRRKHAHLQPNRPPRNASI